MRFSLAFLLLNTLLLAYQDNDLDGVDDAVDLCPNTSFDKLVNEDGCPEDEIYLGKITFQIGNDISFDEFEQRTDNFNFFGNYQYRKWNISLSNANQTSFDSNNNASTSSGDLYLSTGYNLNFNKIYSKIIVGTKIALAKEEVGTGENDYFTSVSLSHLINNKQNIFSYLSYSLSGDNNENNYKNTLAYSIGTGYMLTTNCYSSISYDYGSSIYEKGEDYKAFSFFNTYSFLEDYSISLNYTRALDEVSFEHTLSLKLGVTFD